MEIRIVLLQSYDVTGGIGQPLGPAQPYQTSGSSGASTRGSWPSRRIRARRDTPSTKGMT